MAGTAADLFDIVIGGSSLFLRAILPGDFDSDGDVDGRDFLIWQRGGSPNPLSATDLADWQANYGTNPLTATASVPEPATVWPVLLAADMLGYRMNRRNGAWRTR